MSPRLDPAVATVRRAVRVALSDLGPGTRLLVACSGGADSMALAAATVFEAGRAGWLVEAAVVDHGLQAGSGKVAETVVQTLRDLGCPATSIPVSVQSQGGPESAARDARYATLRATAESTGATVLLGHTLDDQAETVLLGLARGSGTRSLAGMAAALPGIRRPLLEVSRAQTHRACAAQGLAVWDDPHNTDPRFQRVRVRHTVLPVLEQQLGPGVTEALARTARAARMDADALDELARSLYAAARSGEGRLGVAQLSEALPALRRRVLRLAALDAGAPAGELFAVHIDSLEALVVDWRGQRGADLPGRVVGQRERDQLWIRRR